MADFISGFAAGLWELVSYCTFASYRLPADEPVEPYGQAYLLGRVLGVTAGIVGALWALVTLAMSRFGQA